MSTKEKLEKAIALVKQSRKDAGQQLLAEVLRQDPGSEAGWLWLSSLVDSQDQRVYYLAQVLEINPHNAAACRELDRLRPQSQPQPAPPGAPPPETRPADLPESAAPPPPDKEPALVLTVVGIALFFAIFSSLVAYLRDPANLVLNAPYVVYRVILLVVGLGLALGGALGTWQALNPSSSVLSEEDLRGRGKERYKSMDDLFDIGVYIGEDRRHRHGRRRGKRYRLW